MSAEPTDDQGDKFDRFIRNFDETLQTDTSTRKTIVKKTPQSLNAEAEEMDASASRDERSQSPINQNHVRLTSPLLSTPTKPSRNSIPLENQPLRDSSASDDHQFNLSSSHQRTGSSDTLKAMKLPDKQRLDLTPTEPVYTPGQRSLTRSNTMSSVRLGSKKGLNLNLSIKNKQTTASRVSPSMTKLRTPETPNNPSIKSNVHSTGKVERSRRRRTSSSLSSHSAIAQDLKNSDFSDSLRELALKEMKIIELKDQMKLLQQRINTEEEELKILKSKVGHNLKDLSPAQNTLSPSYATANRSRQGSSPSRQSIATQNTETENNSKRQSVWSKPINILNQFDQILQNEIEKLNREAFPTQSIRQHPAEALNEQDEISRSGNNNKSPISSRQDDVLNSVSNSLWSFMSDVKHGLLGDDYSTSSQGQERRNESVQSKTRSSNEDLIDMSNDRENDNDQEMISINKEESI